MLCVIDLLKDIVQKAQSDVILFTIVLALIMFFVVKPLYVHLTKYLENKEKGRLDREEKLLNVIQGNSTVMAELKTLLTSTNENCHNCKTEQIGYFKRFEEKQDTTALVLNDLEHNIDTIAQNLSEGKNNCIVVLTKLENILTTLQPKPIKVVPKTPTNKTI